jgi:hypothetical protein
MTPEDKATVILKECTNEPFLNMMRSMWPRFVTSPASTKKEYHGAHSGGLLEHCLAVHQTFMQLDEYTNHNSPIVLCFGHDIGKCYDYYEKETSDWHRNKLGKYYSVNKHLPISDHLNLSLYVFQVFGVILSEYEYHAMLYHHGQDRNQLNNTLTLNLFYADMKASHIEKK